MKPKLDPHTVSREVLKSVLQINRPSNLDSHLIAELDKMPLAYIQLMNAMFPTDNLPQYPRDVMGTFGTLTKHLVMANGGYNRETGEQELEKGIAKMISYGVLFLANPDLPKRFELFGALNQHITDLFPHARSTRLAHCGNRPASGLSQLRGFRRR